MKDFHLPSKISGINQKEHNKINTNFLIFFAVE